MAAVMPIVSVGLGVVSSMGAASAQRKQADSQAKALEQQTLIQRDQLALATQQLEAQKQTAEYISQREQTINQAQIDQARLLANENEQRQQLAYINAETQIEQQRAQAKMVADQILGGAATENTQMLQADANSMEQLADVIAQTSGVSKDVVVKFLGMTGGKAQSGNTAQVQQQMGLDAIAQYQRGIENSNAVDRQVGYNTRFAEENADLQARYGDLASAFNLQNLGSQRAMDDVSNRLAQSDITYTGQRNAEGIDAQRYATIGAANMSQANANLNARNQSVATQAQLSSIRSGTPGLLSMANTLGQGFNALNQLGVFGMNKPQALVQPSVQPGYSIYQGAQLTPFSVTSQPSVQPLSMDASALNSGSSLNSMFGG